MSCLVSRQLLLFHKRLDTASSKSRKPTNPQGVMGVVWLGGAAIRAGYMRLRSKSGGDANQARWPDTHLREVLADQSDCGHHASVIG